MLQDIAAVILIAMYLSGVVGFAIACWKETLACPLIQRVKVTLLCAIFWPAFLC